MPSTTDHMVDQMFERGDELRAKLVGWGLIPDTCTMEPSMVVMIQTTNDMDHKSRYVDDEYVGHTPCTGCNADRAKCGGKPKGFIKQKTLPPAPPVPTQEELDARAQARIDAMKKDLLETTSVYDLCAYLLGERPPFYCIMETVVAHHKELHEIACRKADGELAEGDLDRVHEIIALGKDW